MFNTKNIKTISMMLTIIILLIPSLSTANSLKEMEQKIEPIDFSTPIHLKTINNDDIVIVDENTVFVNNVRAAEAILVIVSGVIVGLILRLHDILVQEVTDLYHSGAVERAFNRVKSLTRSVVDNIKEVVVRTNNNVPISTTIYSHNNCVLSSDGRTWICPYSL